MLPSAVSLDSSVTQCGWLAIEVAARPINGSEDLFFWQLNVSVPPPSADTGRLLPRPYKVTVTVWSGSWQLLSECRRHSEQMPATVTVTEG